MCKEFVAAKSMYSLPGCKGIRLIIERADWTMTRTFRRVAIVNRGEAAMRFLQSARELQLPGGGGLRTIALFTDADQDSWFVREADEAVGLGPALRRDGTGGPPRQAYVDLALLEATLVSCGAEAAWVGWGFVAEDPEFAELCDRLGIVFIGPPAAAMRTLGNKISAKLLAEAAGLPVAPWSGGPVRSLEEATAHASRIGFPLLVKAAAGGGGRGMRVVDRPEELADALDGAQREAAAAFGDGTVFVERKLEAARHVEVQVVADDHGTVWALGVRDCSVQRRNQKVIEESSSPALDRSAEAQLEAAAVELCRRAGYRNAGTVEFLYQPDDRSYVFMEMNARLQVEHPVTEMTTGVDLVKLQLELAAGAALPAAPPARRGHAIEVRLNAEDPSHDFAPSPGRLVWFKPAIGGGVRVDAGFAEGDRIPGEFDSMIAKLIAYGADRPEALGRLRRALRMTEAVIAGGVTNRAFLATVVDHPAFVAGNTDVAWMNRALAAGELHSAGHAELALLQAAIEAYDIEWTEDQRRFYATARAGRPEPSVGGGRQVNLSLEGNVYSCAVSHVGLQRYVVELDGQTVELRSERLSPYQRRTEYRGDRINVIVHTEGSVHLVELGSESYRVGRGDAGLVRSPAPGVVVAVHSAPGAVVVEGQALLILEAMKTESVVRAPFSGTVLDVLVGLNSQVDSGSALIRMEVTATARSSPVGARRLALAGTADPTSAVLTPQVVLGLLEQRLLGYDFDPRHGDGLLGWLESNRDPASSLEDEALEDDLLELFIDTCSLSLAPGRPDVFDSESGRDRRDYLAAVLADVDRADEIAPPQVLSALDRLLARGGADRSNGGGIAEGLVRLYRGQQEAASMVPSVVAILDRRFGRSDTGRLRWDEPTTSLLTRLVEASDGLFPAVAEHARMALYRLVEEPLLIAERKSSHDAVDRAFDAFLSEGDPQRADAVDALVELPQSVVTPLMGWLNSSGGGIAAHSLALEVLIRHTYRRRDLRWLASRVEEGRPVVLAAYGGTPGLGVLATSGTRVQIMAVLESLAKVPLDLDAAHVALDLAVVGDPVEWAGLDGLASLISRVETGGRILTVSVRSENTGVAGRGSSVRVFRVDQDGALFEDLLLRDLHPATAERIELWRLSRFRLARLRSAEGVYLFRGAAEDNPADERLFALTEVDNLTTTDAASTGPAVPELERAFLRCAAALRRAVTRLGREGPMWNRIVIYVEPVWQVTDETLKRLAHKVAPAGRDLGLEKVVLRVREPGPGGTLRDVVIHMTSPVPLGMSIGRTIPSDEPVRSLSRFRQSSLRMRRRGLTPPYDIVLLLTSPEATHADFPVGEFVELDLNDAGELVPVQRAPGDNTAGVVIGRITNFTDAYPEGMGRVIVLNDPTKNLAALAEPECRRIIAALDLAEQNQEPLEWFAVSSGARVAMDSGTENMDWTAAVLRRLVEVTEDGLEINVITTGVNVGAQSYWNAEATMLTHTRGILVMVSDSAMVLTGKAALDASGGVSASDNRGIGGFREVMGPNGEGQYWADDLQAACACLFSHYEHTYRAPGEASPRPLPTTDPPDRDISSAPHPAAPTDAFRTIGDVFSLTLNPERKKPFEIRAVMGAVVDTDRLPLERWARWEKAETAVVWDARVGGQSVCLIGIASANLPRRGLISPDGPHTWTAGTLFPLSSKKIARALNAASGSRPVVVLANLSGFDGSPESMRELQLEYGAEIGRAVVKFQGSIVFCVISRYHGGAFVVFSKSLNPGLEVAALEGSRASVIGGGPASCVVFAREVADRVRRDPRITALESLLRAADGEDAARLQRQLDDLQSVVRVEMQADIAAEFDTIHTIERAQSVGSVDHIIPVSSLRPYLIAALQRGRTRSALQTQPPRQGPQ